MAKLILVPTPIGNLEDITLRSLRVLKEADLILAEDTRTSSVLLRHYEISSKMSAFHQHNEHRVLERVISQIQLLETVALITDAGTPGISDPGFLLVRECLKNDIEVECLPGAAALIPALINSGFPCERFLFEGFLPAKKGRQTKFRELASLDMTIVFYESPHRLVRTLEELIPHLGAGRMVAVSRELTKIHEENVRLPLSEMLSYFKEKGVKGELVVVISPPD